MTFLELCQKVRQRADIPGAGPATVQSQVGLLEKVVGWVADAWMEIQGAQQWWLFKMVSASAGIAKDVDNYPVATFLPADFDFFWTESIYLKLGSVNKGKVALIDYDQYLGQHKHSNLQTGPPSEIAISPSGTVYFNKIPDQAYQLDFDYQKTSQELKINADIPNLHKDFHDVIWRRALVSYGEHYGAPEVYQPENLYLVDRMQELQNRFLPKVSFRENAYLGVNAYYGDSYQ